MQRWLVIVGVCVVISAAGCAGPAKLAERSRDKLAEGDMWKAWTLATRALDKAPANAGARAAAAEAAAVIAEDWQRRIVALAAADSLAAAQQALAFSAFRTGAIRYTTVPVSGNWMQTEQRLRESAARTHFDDGLAAAKAKRPKRAHAAFMECRRYVPGFRDAESRAARALEQATTRVAVVPLQSGAGAGAGDRDLGRGIAASWSGALAEHLPPGGYFTRIVPAEDVERHVRVSELGRTSRSDAIRIGQQAGAHRIVWGVIGPVESHTSLHFYKRNVWRRLREKDDHGRTTTRWVEVPIQVVSRVRTVDVDLAYEVIATKGGATLTRASLPQRMVARAVWTSYAPEDDPDTYALVTETMRQSNPEQCKAIESEWAAVVGAGTTLAQVLDAKRTGSRNQDRASVLARYAAGAAFVMLEDLPDADELAHASLAASWKGVHESLVQLDAVDDVDLGGASASR